MLPSGGELCAAISEQLNCERIRDEQESQRAPLQNYLGVGQPQLIEAMALMEANLEEPISTAELALLVGVSVGIWSVSFRNICRPHRPDFICNYVYSGPSSYYGRQIWHCLRSGWRVGSPIKTISVNVTGIFGTPPGKSAAMSRGCCQTVCHHTCFAMKPPSGGFYGF
nr:hypothetical protein [Aliamphritea spongicola]